MKYLVCVLLLALPCLAFAQSPPPIDPALFKTPGKIVAYYDEFTDKTRNSVLIRLVTKEESGLGLIVTGFHDGKTPTNEATVNLFFLFVADKPEHKDEPIFLLIDRERLEIKPAYFTTRSPDDKKAIEVLCLPTDLTASQLHDLSTAKVFRGRIGSYLEFEIDQPARQLLADVAKLLSPKQK